MESRSADPNIEDRIEAALREFAPGARLLRAWPLAGGISAHMTAFEIERKGRRRERLIARQHGPHKFAVNPDFALHEFRILTALRAAGLPVPTPRFIETRDRPFIVVDYIEGALDLNPSHRAKFLDQYMQCLVGIHRVDLSRFDRGILPVQRKGYGDRTANLNVSLREDEIRDRLAAGQPAPSGPPVLCHGDLWPGNVLWRESQIVGILDWEETVIGDPLFDLALCRLDLLWILGPDAMQDFTRRYQAQTNLDLANLPYWDLCVSLRPISNLDEWAATYPALGRPDVTETAMRRDHQWFVAQALTAWPSFPESLV